MARTALIAGAGIGGLSAGIALQRAGWNVRIFERAASPRELGFGLLLVPTAVAALRELGVANAVVARGYAPARGEVRRADGTVLKRGEFPSPEALGGYTVVALRQALHGALLEAVGPNRIVLRAEVTGFSATADRVILHFDGHEAAEGDVLIAADGVNSVIRHQLHPAQPPPRYSGIVAVRGVAHGAVRHLGELSGIYYFGRGIEAFLVRASDTGIYWALSLAEPLLARGMRDPAAILDHMLPHMDATFRLVTDATDEMRADELVDRDPLPSWGTGRVTLLGDAAHPLLPHTGQGAAQAIVDAVALGRQLAAGGDVENALRAYEAERRRSTATLVNRGRRTARIMRTTNPLACYARDTAMRMIPVGLMVKVLATIETRKRRGPGP